MFVFQATKEPAGQAKGEAEKLVIIDQPKIEVVKKTEFIDVPIETIGLVRVPEKQYEDFQKYMKSAMPDGMKELLEDARGRCNTQQQQKNVNKAYETFKNETLTNNSEAHKNFINALNENAVLAHGKYSAHESKKNRFGDEMNKINVIKNNKIEGQFASDIIFHAHIEMEQKFGKMVENKSIEYHTRDQQSGTAEKSNQIKRADGLTQEQIKQAGFEPQKAVVPEQVKIEQPPQKQQTKQIN